MKTPRLPLGLFLAAAVIAADAPPSAVEGVKGVRQEGAAKVKNIDPRTARPVSPEKAEGVEQSATAVKPATGPGTVAAPKGLTHFEDDFVSTAQGRGLALRRSGQSS